MRRLLAPLALLCGAVAAPLTARAWTDPGHRLVAAMAEERLSPAARRLLREIVGEKPISDHDVATWADDVRDKRTGPWHYVNIHPAAERYDAARDSRGEGCADQA